ncbi:hypothetical protein EBR96_09660, partial [bacterium]|nr:hypothetical protein [bacterium]
KQECHPIDPAEKSEIGARVSGLSSGWTTNSKIGLAVFWRSDDVTPVFIGFEWKISTALQYSWKIFDENALVTVSKIKQDELNLAAGIQDLVDKYDLIAGACLIHLIPDSKFCCFM